MVAAPALTPAARKHTLCKPTPPSARPSRFASGRTLGAPVRPFGPLHNVAFTSARGFGFAHKVTRTN